MSCEIISGFGAVFSVWGEPSRADIDRVAEAMRTARANAGEQITYVTRVPMDAPAPEPEVRRRLDALMPMVVENCATYHVILEGGGFLAAVKRSVLVSIFQIRWRSGTFFVHSNCDEVLAAVSPSRRAGVEALLKRAREQGLLTVTPGLTNQSRRRNPESSEREFKSAETSTAFAVCARVVRDEAWGCLVRVR
jgi:hypothetical protein